MIHAPAGNGNGGGVGRGRPVEKVLILGSGAIKIGQAGEFDYSGSQAIKALSEDGVATVLVNPNIATIQTSEGMADKVYFLPIDLHHVTKVIEKERPDGIMLGFGGQTALNVGLELEREGILGSMGVRVLGTPVEAIRNTEDRDLFVRKLGEMDLKTPVSRAAAGVDEALGAARDIGYPVMCRIAYALGGLGSGVARDEAALKDMVTRAFSHTKQVLVEEYLHGWKELEYEVVRDRFDNCVVVCSMENLDPMGIHTGESIVVAPVQTLSSRENFNLRTIAIGIIRHLGIVGECNVQFALDPRSEDYRIIEVNARLSRSSALASKATGYPLAFVAAKLALGRNLTQLPNTVTGVTAACFEPALDYVVLKFPRWDLDKFRNVAEDLGSEMKSVGEVMAIGRTFEEALQKAMRMTDTGMEGLVCNDMRFNDLEGALRRPTDKRVLAVAAALRRGFGVGRIHELTGIDRWFLHGMAKIVELRSELEGMPLGDVTPAQMREVKVRGFSDRQIAILTGSAEGEVRTRRKAMGIVPWTKQIDTLGAEYPALTNYLYLTYSGCCDDTPAVLSDGPAGRYGPCIDDAPGNVSGNGWGNSIGGGRGRSDGNGQGKGIGNGQGKGIGNGQGKGIGNDRGGGDDPGPDGQRLPARRRAKCSPGGGRKVVVLGGGPYRIGSSVEFDWCCVNSVMTLRDLGYRSIMINSNPETVSTDYDICDSLYFDELTFERVMDICEKEDPLGVIVSMGGQIPNNLAMPLDGAGVRVLGTSPDMIDNAEDRHKFSRLLDTLDIDQPRWAELDSLESALAFAGEVGYPVLIRPSYVLSGAAMSVALSDDELKVYLERASRVGRDHPVVISKFIESGKEIEIDAVARDGEMVLYAISEHVENAGVHSGDATLVLPPQRTYLETMRRVKMIARAVASSLEITGPFNIQFIARNNEVKVIECNLRASRSFPFVSKVLRLNLIDAATRAILGHPIPEEPRSSFDLDYVGVKAPQFSFTRLNGSDPVTNVEMTSTGEVACLGDSFNEAYLKSLMSVGFRLPKKKILLSTGSIEKKAGLLESIRSLMNMGYEFYATGGTATFLKDHGIPSEVLHWPLERTEPNTMTYIAGGKVDLVINIPKNVEKEELDNDYMIRRRAVDFDVPLITNLQLAKRFVEALEGTGPGDMLVKSWDEYC